MSIVLITTDLVNTDKKLLSLHPDYNLISRDLLSKIVLNPTDYMNKTFIVKDTIKPYQTTDTMLLTRLMRVYRHYNWHFILISLYAKDILPIIRRMIWQDFHITNYAELKEHTFILENKYETT